MKDRKALTSVLTYCSNLLDSELLNYKALTGGDINEVYLLITGKGSFVVKMNEKSRFAAMFEQEAIGLQALQNTKAIAVPKMISTGEYGDHLFLILEYIATGSKSQDFWERFGRQLAAVHRQSASHFGGFADNYIGALPQYNPSLASWPDFYAQARLQPQLEMAIERGVLAPQEARRLEQLINHLPELVEAAKPSLIHGDLWSGNYLVNTAGQPVLIDPAVCYASREMDLAMTRLFGGFDAAFYAAYEEAWALPAGHSKRVPLYQLYYLLVHLNLFGRGYWSSVENVLKQYKH